MLNLNSCSFQSPGSATLCSRHVNRTAVGELWRVKLFLILCCISSSYRHVLVVGRLFFLRLNTSLLCVLYTIFVHLLICGWHQRHFRLSAMKCKMVPRSWMNKYFLYPCFQIFQVYSKKQNSWKSGNFVMFRTHHCSLQRLQHVRHF